MVKFVTHSDKETKKLAASLAKRFLNPRRHTPIATVIGLVGDLGAGKTTFIQGFAKAFGIKRHLTSPTFLIVRRYQNLYHIDAYRLKSERELTSLGFKAILRDPRNIVLIEWADKIKKILPRDTVWLSFEHGRSLKQRVIKIK